MDLIKVQKKAILVPTPGQTEQEYLAKNLMVKKYFFSVNQERFNLENILKNNNPHSFTAPILFTSEYKKLIRELATC